MVCYSVIFMNYYNARQKMCLSIAERVLKYMFVSQAVFPG